MHSTFPLSKKQTYWLCQVFGWSSIVVVETINYTFVLTDGFQWEFVTAFSIQAFFGLIVTHFYKVIFIKSSTFEKPLRRLFVKGLIDTFSISFIITILVIAPSFTNFSEGINLNIPSFILEIFGRIMNQGRYVVVWIIIYYMYKVLQRNRLMAKEKMESENLLTTIELDLLKTQLNPHFLFNALNSIKALILIDAEKAREALVKLGELLTFSLSHEKTPLIGMNDEIYNVEKYLELEKIRFGSRLDYKIKISEPALTAQVPPALILTMAENAIKHGITQLPDGGQIDLEIQIVSEQILIEMQNSGVLK